MKRLLISIIALSLILSFGVNTTSYASTDESLFLYSQDCPSAAIEYARSNFCPFLVSSLESGSIQSGAIAQLGTPFTIQSQYLSATVYYFPIISNGIVIATFRVYEDTTTNTYVGIMSKFLADELSSLNTTSSTPALLFVDEGNIMANVNGQISILINDPDGTPPAGQEPSPVELHIVTPLHPLVTFAIAELNTPFSISKYLNLDLVETQGSENWCIAYASSAIIRYVTKNSTPRALDIMKMFYDDPKDDDMLNGFKVIVAGISYGLSPIYAFDCVPSISEIDAGRPVVLRCQMTTDTGNKKYHALVMRGYNVGTNVYSIWNPWHNYYESMSMSTREYIVGDRTYTWIETIYNWK